MPEMAINPEALMNALEYIEHAEPYPEGRFADRGIVMAAGGEVLMANAYVTIALLRQHGCRLHIELWYDGASEKDEVFEQLIEPFGVKCIDAMSRGFVGFPMGCEAYYQGKWRYPDRWVHGYNLKVFAVKNSAYQEVLFIDADNNPAADPSFLFDDPGYKQHGYLFWPDPLDAKHGLDLTVFGLSYEGDLGTGLESGQMMLDKTKCWKQLQLVEWYNRNAAYFYQGAWGDKDTFTAAWIATKKSLNVAPASASCQMRAIRQHAPDGSPLFYHRAGESKMKPAGWNPVIPTFPFNDDAIDHLATYRDQYRLRTVSAERRAFEQLCYDGLESHRIEEGITAVKVRGNTWLHILDSDTSIGLKLKKDGYWESFYTLFCKRTIQPGWICFDVGANYGYFTTLFSELVGPRGRVIAFEPNPRTLDCLRRSCSQLANVQISGLVVSHVKGNVDFWIQDDNTANNSVFGGTAGPRSQPLNLLCDTLDALTAKLPRVDFVKIDVEGGEMSVWDGMQTMINRGARILMEIRLDRYTDPIGFIERIKQRFPTLYWIDYAGHPKVLPDYMLWESKHQDWMLYLDPDMQ